MATDVERLIVSMEARLSKFDRDMRKASGMADRTARSIESRFSRMEKKVSMTGANLARGLIAPLAGAIAGREVLAMADNFTKMQNSLRAAGIPAEQLTQTMDKLLAIANRSGTEIGGVVSLFQRLSGASKELGVSQEEVFRATENINLIMGAAGADASTMSAAMLQLGQAFASAKVEAEEFNPLIDTAPALLQAAANGIEEAGGSINKLRQLVKDGKLSGEQFFNGFLRGSQAMADAAVKGPQTFAQRLTALRNELTAVIGNLNQSTGATNELNQVMDRLSDIIKDPAFSAALASIAAGIGNIAIAIASLIKDGNAFIGWLGQMRREAQEWMDVRSLGVPFPGDSIGAAIDKQRAMNADAATIERNPFDVQRATTSEATYNAAITSGAAVKPLPLAELGAAPIGKTSGGSKSGGGTKEDPWETIWGLGVGREQHIEAMKKAQEELNEKIEESKQLTTDFLQTFASGMMAGKNATEAMSEALSGLANQLMDKALEMAVNNLFGTFASSLGGTPAAPPGGYTGLIPTSFGGFRAAGGPVRAGSSYVVGESGPELFMPRQNGSIAPGGGETVVRLDLSPDVEARVLNRANENTRVTISRYDKSLPKRMPSLMTEAQARRM